MKVGRRGDQYTRMNELVTAVDNFVPDPIGIFAKCAIYLRLPHLRGQKSGIFIFQLPSIIS
jgi:hypothetical protein